jgi:hypothetical protein
MRTQNARPVKLTPVDEEHRGRLADLGEQGRMDALFDQNLFRMHVRRERSSAYWFAASIWGICGLVIGACMGAYMMYVAYVGITPTVRENLVAGAAINDARDTVNRRPSLVDQATNPSQSEP